MENQIKSLLKKYISGKTDKQERADIRHSVSQMSDKELELLLWDVWNDYDDIKEANSDFNVILNKIRQPQRRIISWRPVASVAASILLCVMLGLQVYNYKDNRRLNEFVNQEAIMNVESGERTNITLPDGTRVALNAGTTISYSVNYGLKNREVNLSGEAFFEVVKNPDKPFKLNTEYVGVEVLGTEFNVNAYADMDWVETTLINGSVKLTTKGATPQSIIMSPKDKVVYSKAADKLSIVSGVSTRQEIAWMEGYLVFRSIAFGDVIKKLEKRYGVEIEIMNQDDNIGTFTGSFKEDYVNGALKILQDIYNFTYTDHEGRICIYFKN